jgi:two-component system, LytTR family, response regulator LytT
MNGQFHVIIIEDERLAVVRLGKMLAHCDPAFIVVACLGSVEASLQWLLTNPAPHLIFLDIYLEDGSGFAILEQVPVGVPVVIVSAFDEHKLYAPVRYFSFLNKPVCREDLCNVLQQCRATILHKG